MWGRLSLGLPMPCGAFALKVNGIGVKLILNYAEYGCSPDRLSGP
jgi:hypothetical protein